MNKGFRILFCSLVLLLVGFGMFRVAYHQGESAVIESQIVYGSGNTFYSDYEGEVNTYHYDDNAMTLKSVTDLMGEDWQQVVIKQGTKIIYNGDSKNVPQDYNSLIVENIANCDDDFAITIFVK